MRVVKFLGMVALGAFMSCTGCGNSVKVPAKVPETIYSDQALVEQWRAIAKGDYHSMDTARAISIVDQLSKRGSQSLQPILDTLASPSETPVIKMLAVICLTPHINTTHLDWLLTLTNPDQEISTRGCATHLLGTLHDERATRRLSELIQDTQGHVAKIAALVLMRKGDSEGVQRALDLWELPDTTDDDRTEIILGFPVSQSSAHLNIYRDALKKSGIKHAARLHALQALATHGTANDVEDIKIFLQSATDSELISMAEAAISAINSRNLVTEKPGS